MKGIKKIAEVTLYIIAAIAFIMMMAEAKNIFMQIVCTGGSAFVLYLCIKGIEKINPSIVKEEDTL